MTDLNEILALAEGLDADGWNSDSVTQLRTLVAEHKALRVELVVVKDSYQLASNLAIAAKVAEHKALREALKKYGQHLGSCAGPGQCDCGLYGIRKALGEAKHG
jgi:hypothetical protein